ncbi:MAG: transglutaminase-like domain-containing protein, partial [Candidatus Micrarchaeia archaeon]
IHDGAKLACSKPYVTNEEDYPWGTVRDMAVTLPSCENGDVYQVITSSNFSNQRTGVVEDSWYFTMTSMNGTAAYSEWSRLEVSVPNTMPLYHYFHSKTATATNTTVNGVTKYVFEQKNMPPIVTEQKMPALKEVEDWMEYASSDDFGAVSSWLQSGYEDAIKPDASVIAKATEIVGNSQGEEAIGKIYDWTRKNIEYKSGTSTGFHPNNASYVLKAGYANSQDVGALLTALLKSRGFDAEPAIVGSNKAMRMGTLDQFDYIITVAHYQGN